MQELTARSFSNGLRCGQSGVSPIQRYSIYADAWSNHIRQPEDQRLSNRDNETALTKLGLCALGKVRPRNIVDVSAA